MPTRNVSLPDGLDAYVDAQVESGKYGNASEVVRTALRLMQERDAHQAALRAALERGISSGVADEGAFSRVRAKLGLG